MEFEFVQVHVTVPSSGLARELGERLVAERLAACIQHVADIDSMYLYDGSTERTQESLLIVKTAAAKFDALATRVRELHPYDVPQVTGVPIVVVDAAYADWMRSVLS